jgi:hypothetical protein
MHQAEQAARAGSANGSGPLFRKPRRITITVPDQIYRSLLERSSREGRSISNLAAYLLERAVASEQRAETGQGERIAADRGLIS